jgi:hypothetical protein
MLDHVVDDAEDAQLRDVGRLPPDAWRRPADTPTDLCEHGGCL